MKKLVSILFSVTAMITLVGCEETIELEKALIVETEEANLNIEEISLKDDIPEVSEDPIVDEYEKLFICNNNKFDFVIDSLDGGHGQFSLTGTIITSDEPEPWDKSQISTFIRMNVIDSNSETAFQYFKNKANQGNTINKISNGDLKFAIGLVDNNTISSTALLSKETQLQILAAADTDSEITLNIIVPLHQGRGAPTNFTFACEIK